MAYRFVPTDKPMTLPQLKAAWEFCSKFFRSASEMRDDFNRLVLPRLEGLEDGLYKIDVRIQYKKNIYAEPKDVCFIEQTSHIEPFRFYRTNTALNEGFMITMEIKNGIKYFYGWLCFGLGTHFIYVGLNAEGELIAFGDNEPSENLWIDYQDPKQRKWVIKRGVI